MSKTQPIHLMIPMSGQGTRFQKAGYKDPKPLTPIRGRSIISRLLKNFPLDWPTHFVLAENHKLSQLPQELLKLRPQAHTEFIEPHKKGPSFALLSSLEQVPDEAPVLVSYCDYAMIWDASQFENFVRSSDCDACVISYRGFHAHYNSPVKYAYCRMESERVVEIREKHFFTDNRENEFASSGGYYFKSAALLKDCIKYQMDNGLELNGEYYTSLTVEALLRMNKNAQVRVFEIPGFFQWGTPEDLENYTYWEETYHNLNKTMGSKLEFDGTSLIPMAGYGSRFRELTDLPKPLIPIDGQLMFERAIDSLPQATKKVLVTKPEIAQAISDKTYHIIELEKTPEGQALTTQLGVKTCLEDKPVIVSACDHAVVLNSESWPPQSCDAAIFTIKNFPGVKNKPSSYSYVKTKNNSPEVEAVGVKQAFTDQPENEPLLVGTFWFKTPELLNQSILWLVESQLRVNNELYLDSVFNLLLEQGYKVHSIPLDGYINWGDPDSLREALYWQEIFLGYQIVPRKRYPGSFER